MAAISSSSIKSELPCQVCKDGTMKPLAPAGLWAVYQCDICERLYKIEQLMPGDPIVRALKEGGIYKS